MRKVHILTFSALLLLPFAIYQSIIDFPLAAGITGSVAFIFAFIDNQKITSRFQHISLPFIALVLGYITETSSQGPPYIAAAVFISVIALIARMVFIKTFSYANYKYFELWLALATMTLIALKVIYYPDDALIYMPAYFVFMMLVPHTYVILKNAGMLKKGVKEGYNAKAGVKAPDFILPDQFGNLVKLSDFENKRHVLLIFVRGDWCPYCHMIMRTYMRDSNRFKEKNIMLIAVGPDPVGINREMAEKLGLDYLVLSDEKMKVAQEYGIRLPDFRLPNATFHEEGMPLPASFLIDKTGSVVYTSRTEKVGEFLDPRLIFPIVDSLNK